VASEQRESRWLWLDVADSDRCGPVDHRFVDVKAVLIMNQIVVRYGSAAIWLGFGLCYLIWQWGHLHQKVPSVFAHYVTDVLCLPLVLGIVLFSQRKIRAANELVLPRWHGLAAVVIYSLYFEWLLPGWDARATADLWDCLSYLMGWLLFESLINRP
jgi:hypothetical protein